MEKGPGFTAIIADLSLKNKSAARCRCHFVRHLVNDRYTIGYRSVRKADTMCLVWCTLCYLAYFCFYSSPSTSSWRVPVRCSVIAPGNHSHPDSLRYSQRERLSARYRYAAQRLARRESWHGFAVTERANLHLRFPARWQCTCRINPYRLKFGNHRYCGPSGGYLSCLATRKIRKKGTQGRR